MRRLLPFALILAIGCGPKSTSAPTSAGSTPTSAGSTPTAVEFVAKAAPTQAIEKKVPRQEEKSKPIAAEAPKVELKKEEKLSQVDHVHRIVRDYKENEVAADEKYKGKRIEFSIDTKNICKKNDKPAAAAFTLGDTIFRGNKIVVLPKTMNVYAYATADGAKVLAAAKPGEFLLGVGTVKGIVRDGISRGNLEANLYAFYVEIENCEFISMTTKENDDRATSLRKEAEKK